MPDQKQQQLEVLGSTVSVIFYSLMFVASLAFIVTLLRPGLNGEMLFAAAWMCMLASAGCLVWKFALGAMQDRLLDDTPVDRQNAYEV
jgi:hypothetical protein